jgi:hypothetical protein
VLGFLVAQAGCGPKEQASPKSPGYVPLPETKAGPILPPDPEPQPQAPAQAANAPAGPAPATQPESAPAKKKPRFMPATKAGPIFSAGDEEGDVGRNPPALPNPQAKP